MADELADVEEVGLGNGRFFCWIWLQLATNCLGVRAGIWLAVLFTGTLKKPPDFGYKVASPVTAVG
jgi:hypothetical protein